MGELLALRDVRRYFPLKGGFSWGRRSPTVRAVDGVSLSVQENETVSLVGESGCGKTTTAKLVLRLEKPDSGQILFRGADLDADRRARDASRGAIQAVFQNPWSSLNPRMRVGDSIAEPLIILGRASGSQLTTKVEESLLAVGLEPATARNYPHEFSGGQRQRIAIARAMSVNPDLLVLDEPVSALDVSIRAQIMNLLRDLQLETGVSYLLIAHDLATVRYMSHHVSVMYLGQIVETATSEAIFRSPSHPYTVSLIESATPAVPGEQAPTVLSGDLPSPASPPLGCRFHTRCWLYERLGRPAACRERMPELEPGPSGGLVRCHFKAETMPASGYRGDLAPDGPPPAHYSTHRSPP